MSALREAMALAAHRWITSTFACCGGHPLDPADVPPECEQLADAIIADLGWPVGGP